jgi:hypothetical protein
MISFQQVSANLPPLIENQEFKYMFGLNSSFKIGTVVATDPDVKDQLVYRINSGDKGLVSLDNYTGELTLTAPEAFDKNVNTVINLVVEIEDDGQPSYSRTANVTVTVIPEKNIVYIDPSFSGEGSGTIDNPFNSLKDIEFASGKSYLMKRNTVSTVDEITINSDDILISAYGEGDLPVIISNTYEHVFKTVDKQDVNIEMLHIEADNAVSGIYFLGPSSKNIHISKCVIVGPDYGIRLINVNDVKIQYCRFEKTRNAIYQIALRSKINYNLFNNNHTGIQIMSSGDETNIFNNLFYNNAVALKSEDGALRVFNNIFYQKNSTDKAVWVSSDDYLSNFNLIYPEFSAFYVLNDINYNKLAEIKESAGQEMNSLSEDPGFIDVENNNFELEKSSPAVDAGVYVGLIYDFNGMPIPFGYAPDIGLIESSEIILDVDQTVDFYPESLGLDIYPNPATDRISINYPATTNLVSIRVYDLIGSKLIDIEMENASFSPQDYSLDISTLTDGIYVLQIRDGDRIGVRKFVKR